MTKKLLKLLLFNSFNRKLATKRIFPLSSDHGKELPTMQYTASTHKKNRVYVWGNALTGALGIPHSKKKENIEFIQYMQCPKRLHFAETNAVTAAACGFGFTVYAINSPEDGYKLYGTGLNTDSQIGYHAFRENKPLGLIIQPQPIFLPTTSPIRKLSAGRAHVAVLTDTELFIFGNNSYGQCGRTIIQDEDYSGNKHINALEELDGQIVDIECGQDHTLAVLKNGAVYSCGWGADGQTGLGHYDNNSKFTKLSGDIENEKIVKVSCTSDFVLALNDSGDVFGWGNTEYNQMQMPNNEQQVSIPTHIKMVKKFGKIIDVAAGGSFCLVLNDNGHVFVWGFGLLGTGPEVQHSKSPIQIPSQLFGFNDFNPQCRVKEIACGLSHMAAVTNTGDLYTWGRNRSSCLGLGHSKDQYFPLKVAIGARVNEVHCGLDHTVAICHSYLTDKV